MCSAQLSQGEAILVLLGQVGRYQCSCLSEQQVYKQVNRIPGGGFEVEGHKLRLCPICITFCGCLSSRYSSEAYGLPVVLCDSKGTPSLHEYLQGYCGVGMCTSSGCYVNEIHCLLKQPIGLWLTEGKYCIVTMGDQQTCNHPCGEEEGRWQV